MSDEELQRLRRIAVVDPTTENLAKLGLAYLRHSVSSQTLRIVGRRWFQKSYGNTYHTVRVYLDDEFLGESNMEYGYGDQYIETGFRIAFQNSDLPPRKMSPNGSPEWTRGWSERTGVKVITEVVDVPRKRDL